MIRALNDMAFCYEDCDVQIAPGMISDLLEKKDKTNTPTNDGKNKNILSGMFGKK